MSRAAAPEKRHAGRIREREQQINGDRGKLKQARDTLADLHSQLRRAMKQASLTDPCQSPSERIYLDIVRNHDYLALLPGVATRRTR
jgi:hypothetical protein